MKHSQSVIESDITFYDSSRTCHSMKSLPQFSKSMSGIMKSTPKQPLPLKLPPKTFNINSLDTVMFDFKTTPSNYLNNSLYITSSTESDIVPNPKSEGKNDDDSNSGYLKMLGVRNCEANNLNVMKSSKSVDKMRNDKCIPVSTSEYVHSNIDKDKSHNQRSSLMRKSPPLIKEKPTFEEAVNSSSQYSCQEYEMISNFTSCSKSSNILPDLSPDTPPAIPPRNHHTISPSYSKYKKPVAKTNIREHKSLDQYQLKTSKSLDDNQKVEGAPIQIDVPFCAEEKQDFYVNNVNNLRLNNTQESTDTSIPISNASQERRSQIIEFCEFSNTETDSKGSKCVTNLEINDRPVLSDNFQNRLSDTAKGSGPSLVSSKDSENVPNPDAGQDITYRHSSKEMSESKEDLGGFSRRSVQRKSVPTKSRFSNKKTNSVDGDLPSIDGSKSQIPIANRFTASFLKRKAKANT